jgi:hypothetical protein
MEHSYIGNSFMAVVERQLYNQPQRLVWAGDYADTEQNSETNLYHTASNKKTILSTHPKEDCLNLLIRYLVNHDTKQIVELQTKSSDELKIHPLSLLTVEGNGRGGGDYDGSGPVGVWARHKISTETDESVKNYANDGRYKFWVSHFVED